MDVWEARHRRTEGFRTLTRLRWKELVCVADPLVQKNPEFLFEKIRLRKIEGQLFGCDSRERWWRRNFL